MSTLNGFPFVSQLTQVTEDGSVSNNAQEDCVAASILACVMWLNGVTTVGGNYTPDFFKDQAYSEGYVGGTSADAYVAFCKSLGITLSAIDTSSPAQAVAQAHLLIQNGTAVIFTQIDPYVDTSLDRYKNWTHVCVWYSEDSGGLTAMDPYIDKAVYKSDASWASVLRSSQLWIAQKESIDMPFIISINTVGVSQWFKELNINQWQCLTNGFIIQNDILKWYCGNGYAPYCGLSSVGLPESNEIKIESVGALAGYPFAHLAGHGIVIQYFERGVICYDNGHLEDRPPGAGATYPLHLFNSGPGTDPAIWGLQKDLTTAQQQEATLQAQLTALQNQQSQSSQPDPRIAGYQAQLTTVSGLAQQIVKASIVTS